MHTKKNKKLYLLSFDIDGTLTGPNYSIYGIFGKYEMLLKELQQLPGIEVVLNSGKPFHIVESNAARFGGRYIIACNGAAFKEVGGQHKIFGGGSSHLRKLRALLGLALRDEGVRHINIGNRTYEVVIEEDKHHDIILTIFCEPELVSYRWKFAGGIDREGVYNYLLSLIQNHKLDLHVLHPHNDGAVDVVRLHKGRPIDKSTLPQMVREIWPDIRDIKISMFGDGANDVPAMIAPNVTGITFPEADEEKVKKPVREKGGIITSLPAWIKNEDGSYKTGGGVIEGVKLLAEQDFFGQLTPAVVKICNKYL